jgi:hypothetical protein
MQLLVKNIDDLRKYVSNLNSTFQFSFVEGALADIQSGYLSQIFGSAFIASLTARYNATTPSPALTDQEKALINHIGTANAYLAIGKALPTLLVQLGNSGLYQTESNNSKPLYQWQKIEYENSILESGYSPIETGLQYLWDNRTHPQFAQWKDSPEEAKSVQYFLSTASDFNERFPIANSRRTYEALKPFIREAQQFEIKPLIGAPMYDELVSKIKAFDLGDKYPLLLPYIKDALAQISIARSIGRLTVKADSEGYRVVSVMGSGGDSVKNKTTATMEQLDMLKREAMNSAGKYCNALLNFLNSNIADFPLFTQSDAYIQNQSPTSINSSDSRVVAF